MSDLPSNLERELLAMQPRALDPGLLDGLTESMKQKPSRMSDWFLMGAMGSGLAAAMVVAAMLSVGLSSSRSASAVAPAAMPDRAGDSLTMLARADASFDSIVK